jgi:chromosome segregation ATPase
MQRNDWAIANETQIRRKELDQASRLLVDKTAEANTCKENLTALNIALRNTNSNIEALNTKNQELGHDNERLIAELKDANQKLQSEADRLATLEQDVSIKETEIAQLKDANQKLQSEADRLATLEQDVNIKNSKIAELTATEQKLRENGRFLQGDNDRLKIELSAANQRISALEGEQAGKDASLKACIDDNQRIADDTKKMQDETKSQESSFASKLVACESKLGEMEDIVQDTKGQITTNDIELVKSREQVNSLTIELDDKQKELVVLESDLKSKTATIVKLEKDLDTTKQRANSTKEAFVNMKREVDLTRAYLETSRNHVDRKARELYECQEWIGSAMGSLSLTIESQKSILKELETCRKRDSTGSKGIFNENRPLILDPGKAPVIDYVSPFEMSTPIKGQNPSPDLPLNVMTAESTPSPGEGSQFLFNLPSNDNVSPLRGYGSPEGNQDTKQGSEVTLNPLPLGDSADDIREIVGRSIGSADYTLFLPGGQARDSQDDDDSDNEASAYEFTDDDASSITVMHSSSGAKYRCGDPCYAAPILGYGPDGIPIFREPTVLRPGKV